MIENYLKEWSNKLIQRMESDLDADKPRRGGESSNSNATGNLRASMDWKIITLPNQVIARLQMADYYAYIDLGVAGTESGSGSFQFKKNTVHPDMVDSIAEWISYKAIRVRTSNEQSTQSVLKQRQSMANGIAVNVKKFGISATGFFSNNINPTEIKKLTDDLLQNYATQLRFKLKNDGNNQ